MSRVTASRAGMSRHIPGECPKRGGGLNRVQYPPQTQRQKEMTPFDLLVMGFGLVLVWVVTMYSIRRKQQLDYLNWRR